VAFVWLLLNLLYCVVTIAFTFFYILLSIFALCVVEDSLSLLAFRYLYFSMSLPSPLYKSLKNNVQFKNEIVFYQGN
jgi:hypothetical protein